MGAIGKIIFATLSLATLYSTSYLKPFFALQATSLYFAPLLYLFSNRRLT